MSEEMHSVKNTVQAEYENIRQFAKGEPIPFCAGSLTLV